MDTNDNATPDPDQKPRARARRKKHHTRRPQARSAESYQTPYILYVVRWHDGRVERRRGFVSRKLAEQFLSRITPKLDRHPAFKDIAILEARFSDGLQVVPLSSKLKRNRHGPETYRYSVRWRNSRTGRRRGFNTEDDAVRFHRSVWEFERHTPGFYLYPSIIMRLT